MNTPDVCIPNIGPQERRRRQMFGIISLIAALVILAAMVLAGLDRWWRLVLLIPFWAGMSGIFQARERT